MKSVDNMEWIEDNYHFYEREETLEFLDSIIRILIEHDLCLEDLYKIIGHILKK